MRPDERLPETAPLAMRMRPAAARRLRRPGAGARRAFGPAARDRGGPRRLLDPLRAAGKRQDDAGESDREHDRSSVRGALGRVGDRRPGARGAQGRPGAARRKGSADDPLPRRDPPVQQGAARRASAGGRGGNRDADRRDHREPLLRGQLGAALPEPDLRARPAHGRGARGDRAAGSRGARGSRSRTSSSS